MSKATDSVINPTMRVLSIMRAKPATLACLRAKRPVFLWGKPGIGKSQMVHQLGEATNRPIVDVRLALWDPTEIKGVTYYNPVADTTKVAPPPGLPRDPNSRAIILLDELNQAPPATQAAAYQLVLDRRVGEYVLPDGVDIVASGNREGDKGVTNKMPQPLANRFVHFEIEVKYDDWYDWALDSGIHPYILSFLEKNKQCLYDDNGAKTDKAFSTPRSWATGSTFLYDTEVDADLRKDLIAGTVGEGMAAKFHAFTEHFADLPHPMDVLTRRVTKMNSNNSITAQHAMIMSLCYELKEQKAKKAPDFFEMFDNFLEFNMENFGAEMCVVAARTAIGKFKIHVFGNECKNYDRFYDAYGKYIAYGKS